MIYADNAATTKLDLEAFEAMKPFLIDEYGNASQPYSFGTKSRKAINNARIMIAECIGAYPEEIFFTSGGSESDNWAIKMGSDIFQSRNRIITSSIEHHAVLNTCERMSNMGKEVEYLPVTKEGIVLPDKLEEVVDNNTALVSIMFANNEIGSIQPIRELVEIAHEKKIFFHTDAVQAVGHIQMNVHEMKIDLLSASAHKFNGPKGIGFLYVKKGINLENYIDGGAQEYNRRAGTENVAGIVGMAVALKNNVSELNVFSDKMKEFEQIVLNGLNEADIQYSFNGSQNRIPGNMSLSFKDNEGEVLLHRLDLCGICISTGSACDSKNTKISHVLKAIGLDKNYAEGTIRISFGKYNSINDAKNIVKALISILKR